MKRMIMLAMALLFTSSAVRGADPQWLPSKVDIVGLRSYSGSSGHFVKVTDIGYHQGCENSRHTGIYYLPKDSADAYAMLLSAKLAGEKVLLQVKGYGECMAGYAVIFEIQIGDW